MEIMNEIIDAVIGSVIVALAFLIICYCAEYATMKRNKSVRLQKTFYRVDLLIGDLIEKQPDRTKKIVITASWATLAIILGVILLYG